MFLRCMIGKTPVSLFGASISSLYLHTQSAGQLIVQDLDDIGSNYPNIIKSSFNSYIRKRLNLTCSNEDCLVTIWHHDHDSKSQYHINDASGMVFSIQSKVISEDFDIYFDFGSQTKVHIEKSSHPKKGPSIYYFYQSNSSDSIIKNAFDGNTSSIKRFSSPGMIKIIKSPYKNATIRIVAGSIIRMHDSFPNIPSYGAAKVYNSPNSTYIISDPLVLSSIFPAKQISIWFSLSTWMDVITGLIVFITIVQLLLIVIKHFHFKQVETDSEDLPL